MAPFLLTSFHSQLLSGTQVDGLDDIGREEEVNRPIRQNTNFLLEARQLAEIDGAPHGPSEKAGESHRAIAHEGDAEFSAGCLVADDAERTERVEVKRFQRATFDLGSNIFCERCGFTESELRGRWNSLL